MVSRWLNAKLRGKPIKITRAVHETSGPLEGLGEAVIYTRFAKQVLWLVAFLVSIELIGMLPSIALFMCVRMIFEGETPWLQAVIITACLLIGMYLLFVKLLYVPWPPSLLGDMLPELRELSGRLI